MINSHREDTAQGTNDLHDTIEDEFDEDVYFCDLKKAAIEAAIENSDLMAELFRSERYGYGWI